MTFHQYLGGKEGKRKRGLVAITESGMEYRGTTAESKNTSKYLVGVFKPAKGKLYLMDAGQVIALRQGNVKDAEADEATERAAVAARAEGPGQYNRQAAKQALVEGFGSRRKASDMSVKRSNVVSTENIQSRDAVIALLKNTAAATPQAEDESLSNRPPHNLDAEALSECFPLEGIAPAEELSALTTAGRGLMEVKPRTLDRSPSHLASHMRVLWQAVKSGVQPYWCDDMVWSFAQRADAIQDVPKAQKGAALMHLVYMHILHHLGRRLGDEEQAVQKLTVQQCPQGLATSLVKRFSETQVENGQSKQVRTPDMCDRLLLYIAAQSLNLAQYQVDLAAFAENLKMSQLDARKYFMALGCKSSSKRSADEEGAMTKAGTWMKLSLPLKFPDPPRRQRGK